MTNGMAGKTSGANEAPEKLQARVLNFEGNATMEFTALSPNSAALRT